MAAKHEQRTEAQKVKCKLIKQVGYPSWETNEILEIKNVIWKIKTRLI